jgi:hypothetical protein
MVTFPLPYIQQTTNPLNGSDMLTTLSWFGHMDQQNCSSFFTTSTALDLQSNSQWKLKLMILFHSWMSWSWRGSHKLATKVCWKPTHTGYYLHFKSNHPHHMKRGVVHSLISWAKVIYKVQKDFNEEVKNIYMIWYLMNTHKNLLTP